MDCCAHCIATGLLFSPKVAERDLRRYRRKGPDSTTRLILEELRRQPLEEASLLDIGGGAAGVGTVVEVDASPAYLAVAGRQFAEHGWAERTALLAGDFAALAVLPDPAGSNPRPLRTPAQLDVRWRWSCDQDHEASLQGHRAYRTRIG